VIYFAKDILTPKITERLRHRTDQPPADTKLDGFETRPYIFCVLCTPIR
jgi:hypothetical protein